MDTKLSELRLAARRLLRAPAFSVAVVGTLALAIAANTAIYGVIRRVLLRPLPYPEADRLVYLDHSALGIGAQSGLDMTQGLYAFYGRESHALQQIAVYRSQDMNLADGAEAERVEVATATATLAPALRASAELGRFFDAAEDARGANPVAVLSHGLWASRFGADPEIVGRTVRLDGVPYQIVGVMPRDFAFPDPTTALWIPLALERASGDFGGFSLRGIGRLAPGWTPEGAERELATALPRLGGMFPGAAAWTGNIRLHPLVTPLKDHVVGSVEHTLWILMGAVACVLLIALANVADLLVVRSETRRRELAVRVALGARRRDLVTHFLSEAALLATAGGALGLVLAWGALDLLRAYGPESLPRLAEIRVDGGVLLVTAGIAAFAALVLGALPLLSGARIAGGIREGGRSLTSDRRRVGGRNVLVAGQVALAVVLIVGAALMVRSFWGLRHADPGFAPDGVLAFDIGLPPRDYPTPVRAAAAENAVIDRIRSLPGVVSAGATTCLPFCGKWYGDAWSADGQPEAPGEHPPVVAMRRVSAGFFEALRIPIRAGRPITTEDEERAANVAVISAQLARCLWPGADPIGRRLVGRGSGGVRAYTVVGMAADTPVRDLTENPAPMMYLPLVSQDEAGPGPWLVEFVVRSRTSPAGLVDAIRREVKSVDPGVPVARVRTMETVVADASARLAFAALLLGTAAALALVLGVVGIYGVIAYVVGQRTREFGVRLALGATGGQIAAMMLRYGGSVVGLGIAAGLGGALLLTRVLRVLLFGISPTDPLTFAEVSALVAAAALVAIYVPARRAAATDPVTTLRAE